MISQKYYTAITRYATHTHNHHHQRLIAQHYRQQQNLSTNKQKQSTNTSTTTSPSTTTKTLWKQLKAPVLFGVGLYLGFMVFGEHQETKQGSAYLEGLRAKFWSGVDSGDADGKQG